jgi:hypothetical protein
MGSVPFEKERVNCQRVQAVAIVPPPVNCHSPAPFTGQPPINLSHHLFSPPDRIGDGADGRRNPLSSVVQGELPGYENCDRDQQKTGGERVRCMASVALQRRCSLLMTARSRSYDADPRWPKRSLCTCGMLRPALTPPGNQIAAESAYRLFGVNFDMRKSMSSPTP